MNVKLLSYIIVCSSIIAFDIFELVFVLNRRKKLPESFVNYPGAGWAFYIFSIFLTLMNMVSPFTHGDDNWVRTLIIFSTINFGMSITSFWFLCSVIFLDGTVVVKQTLFSEKRIDLKDPNTIFYNEFPLIGNVAMFFLGEKTITLNAHYSEGEIHEFSFYCDKIYKEYHKNEDSEE